MQVAIISYNRPNYLKLLLESIVSQDSGLSECTFHLFQDHPVDGEENLFKMHECIDTFKEILPKGVVHKAEKNHGIGLNIARAESFVFQELRADYGLFFEDDLILSPRYFRVIEMLRLLMHKNEELAYAACYGLHTKTQSEQDRFKDRLVELGHNWGFILARGAWERTKSARDEYNDILRKSDYSSRDHDAIRKLYRKLGSSCEITSQDAAKTVIYTTHGYLKINTVAVFAEYSGVHGHNFNQQKYEEMRFHETTLYEGTLPDRFCYDNDTREKVGAALKRFCVVPG